MTARKTPAAVARARKPGRPRKATDGTVDLRLRISADLLARVEAAAVADGRSRDAWVRRLLEREMGAL